MPGVNHPACQPAQWKNKMKKLSTLLAAGILALVGSTIPVLAEGPKIETQKLGENIYAISALHYTSLAVIGDKGVLITDTANPYRASLLAKEISKLTDLPVTKIVMTHEHYDHVGGTEVFAKADVIAHENFEMFMDQDPLGLLPDQIDVTFEEKLTLKVGETKVELSHFGPADGTAVAVVHLPKEGIVVTSDMYLENALTPGWALTDSNLLGSRQILNELASWDLNHAINTHSNNTDPALLKASAQFYNDLYDAVFPEMQRLAKEDPRQLIKRVLQMRQEVSLPAYEQWENYKDLPDYVLKMGFAIIHGG
ncbi:Zn-dependent Hydrolase, including glyoxylase [Pseudovibrio sp. JE062]|nr:Zn-dependent Hydrolase, including glyoxylase [Pseudovibrio sp. JE062]